MRLKLESRHFLFFGKIVSTIILLIAILGWAVFVFVILPLILILIYHSDKKSMSGFSTAMALSPMVIMAMLIFRIWKVEHTSLRNLISRGVIQ